MKEVFLLGEDDLETLAGKVASILAEKKGDEKKGASVILLEGELGSGKTTFTKALSQVLGIDKTAVHSPTFILKKAYDGTHPVFKKLVHIDAYRFTHPDEAKVLRLEDDLRDTETLMVVEWPSKMTYLKSDMEITFRVEDEATREITITYEP